MYMCMARIKKSLKEYGQMVKISTMTTAKIQIFYGQNGKPTILPRNQTTKITISTMIMAEIGTNFRSYIRI